jgi:hypothetical protein
MATRTERRSTPEAAEPTATPSEESPSSSEPAAFDYQRLKAENDARHVAERAAAEAAYATPGFDAQRTNILREAFMRADERHNAQRLAILAEAAYQRCLASMRGDP